MGLVKSLLIVGAGAAGAAIVYKIVTAQASGDLPTAVQAAQVVAKKIETVVAPVAAAVRRGAEVLMDYTVLGQALQAAKKAWGVIPTTDQLKLVAQAASPFGVPLEMFVSFWRNEASLRTKGVFRRETGNPKKNGWIPGKPETWTKGNGGSWEKWKDVKAPGSDKTWGQLYKMEDWGSYGPMQLMPFNFVGTPGGLTPGEPLSKGHDTLFNFSQAARLIRDLYKKFDGKWKDVFSGYNSNRAFGKVTTSMFYTLHVATYLKAIGIGGILDDNDIAALKAKIAAANPTQAKAWQADLDKFLALPEPGAVASPVVVAVGSDVDEAPVQDEAPSDPVDKVQRELQAAYLARDLDAVAELQGELESLTGDGNDGDGTTDGTADGTTNTAGEESDEQTA